MSPLSLRFFTLFFVSYLPASCFAMGNDVFKNASYDVCFTPSQDCTNLIVKTISAAKKSIFVQAYSFTSAPIAKALVDAKKKGIEVKVILDKSQFSDQYSSVTFLKNNQINVWNDNSVSIAHNKVMIVDDQTVITGSFNFTKAAQFRNAENVLVITDENLAARYKKNWLKRLAVSTNS